MQKQMEQHNSDYPLLSFFFSILTWSLAAFNATALDNCVLLPVAHLATILSGSVAVVLGCISIKDKLFKGRK